MQFIEQLTSRKSIKSVS